MALVVLAGCGAVAQRIAQDQPSAVVIVVAAEIAAQHVAHVVPEAGHTAGALKREVGQHLVLGELHIELAGVDVLVRLQHFRTLRDGQIDRLGQADGFERFNRLIERHDAQFGAKVFLGGVEQPPKLILLIADGFLRNQDLLDPRRDGGFRLQHVHNGHHAGLGFGAVAGEQFLGGFQGGLGDLQILIRKDQFPIGLFDAGHDGQNPIAQNLLFQFHVVLRDVDERAVDLHPEIAQQGLGQGHGQAGGPTWIE